MDDELLNPYIEDGIYCLRRAARALQERMNRDLFYDAAIYYAFGVEKLCKAIVHRVNPIFLLETHSFDNAAAVLYLKQMTDRAKKKLEKSNPSLLPFKATVIRAAKFSDAIEDNIGRFTELADIRGALAHRSWTDVNREQAIDLLLRTFISTVELFANELDFGVDECFETEEQYIWLKETSDRLLAQENYEEYVKDLLAKHLAIWEARINTPLMLQAAANATEAGLKQFHSGGPYAASGTCPCCKQAAILFYEFTDIYTRNTVTTTGTYAVGLKCFYCGIHLAGYRAVDYFKLNEQNCGPFQFSFKIEPRGDE